MILFATYGIKRHNRFLMFVFVTLLFASQLPLGLFTASKFPVNALETYPSEVIVETEKNQSETILPAGPERARGRAGTTRAVDTPLSFPKTVMHDLSLRTPITHEAFNAWNTLAGFALASLPKVDMVALK